MTAGRRPPELRPRHRPRQAEPHGLNGGVYGPLKLETGTWAKGIGQVVIDRRTAATQHYKLGDQIVISTLGTRHTFTLAGTVSLQLRRTCRRVPSLAVWDIKSAQKLFHREGRFDVDLGRRQAGHDGRGPRARHQAAAARQPEGQERSEAAFDEAADDWDHTIASIRAFLLVFGGIALLIGAFVIFNTLSITVAQRTRELAHAADPRRLAPAGHALGRRSRASCSASSPRPSGSWSATGSRRACSCSSTPWASGCRRARRSSSRAPSSSRWRWASRSRCSPASCPPAARPASRRSPPSARARRCRRQAGRQSHNAGSSSSGSLARSRWASSPAACRAAARRGTLGLFAGIALLARASSAARRVVGWPARRVGGAPGAGQRERRPQPRPHGVDRRHADDRAHARDRRGRARRQPDQRHARGGHRPDRRRLRRRRQGGRSRSRPPGDKLAAVRRRDGASRTSAPSRRSCRAPSATSAGSTPPRSGASTASRGRPARRGRSRSSAATARSSRSASPRTNHLERRRHAGRHHPGREKGTLVVRGIYDAPASAPLLGDVSISRQAFDAAFRNPKNSLTLLDADAARGRGAEVHGRRPRRRDASTPAPRYAKAKTKDTATMRGHPLRAAGLLDRREPDGHGQHDGALGLRAHP